MENQDEFNFSKFVLNIDGEDVVFDDISSIFDLFKKLIVQNSKINTNSVSVLAIIIDCYGLIAILNFFNEYNFNKKSSITYRSHHLIIKSFAIVIDELNKFLGILNPEIKNELLTKMPKSVKSIRNEVHQFRNRDFLKIINRVDKEMGRSRNKKEPMIDIILHYERIFKNLYFIGTNQFEFINRSERNQNIVDSMQLTLREIEKVTSLKMDKNLLVISENIPSYKRSPYSYIGILKLNRHLNERIIDRLLLMLDQVSSVYEFFNYSVSIELYLKKNPFIVFFFRKMVSIVLDETIDNLKNIKEYNRDDSSLVDKLEKVVSHIDEETVEECRNFRNNLHYSYQTSLEIGDTDKSYEKLIKLLEINRVVMRDISSLMNCYPSTVSILTYKLLRFIQL